ncbi:MULTISPECIES: acyl-CoA carboxylase subunit epsilon [unclassified Kitasatospora]|uniref:acyl-CoA carboxylase subunit epsilon n=1 Tax=unclassified Kitasatospora TaxID=2633591 RepID=UPI001ADEFA83|nr:acyl-CoA carboxylase subunit epsilon [Kitasatospora sp. RG8]MBP0455274.1 acyl-CoA carboxylase subunit epsilon [Kitasatospora sp. RG8]
MTASAEPLVRIVRGSLSDEELAALTAVLMARAAAQQAAAAAAPVEPIANWQRLERRPAYFSPVSWQQAA